MTTLTKAQNDVKRLIFILPILLCAVTSLLAQQPDSLIRISPVRPQTNIVLTPPKGTSEEIIQQYVSGDTAKAKAQERKDSLARIYPRYPLLTEVTFGVNIMDPIMMAFGQKYGAIDLSATLNMWNRLQPVLELGLGRASIKPDDLFYHYKGKMSPFVRIGANYNFLFKKTPDYQAYFGFRLGFSAFKYDITDIALTEPYWREVTTLDILNQKSHAFWGEALVGLRIKIWGPLSAGWQLKYHGLFKLKETPNSKPWYIPGYGQRKGPITASFSIYYTLPLSRSKWPAKPEDKKSTTLSGKSSPVMD